MSKNENILKALQYQFIIARFSSLFLNVLNLTYNAFDAGIDTGQ